MFDTDDLEKYAEVLLWGLARGRREPFAKSDFILVNYDVDALPLAEELCAQIHERGYIPVPRALMTARMEQDRFSKANNKRLSTLVPGEKNLYDCLNGCISIFAPRSLTHLAGIDPECIRLSQQARKPLRDIMHTREEMGRLGWTLGMYPTQAMAEQAGMDVAAYAREVRKACYLTDGSPVTRWKLLVKQAEDIREWLNSLGAVKLHVESETVDLHLCVGKKRQWAGVTGRNIPSFELYVSPDWRTVEGVYTADLPSFRSGNIVKDVRLEFTNGRVCHMDSGCVKEFVASQLTMDPGASQVGEFALVDKRFSPISRFMANTLYDENHGGEWGSMHIAVGSSYANTFAGEPAAFSTQVRRELGFNSSLLHWDLVNTERKRVRAMLPGGKGITVYENGEFVM